MTWVGLVFVRMSVYWTVVDRLRPDIALVIRITALNLFLNAVSSLGEILQLSFEMRGFMQVAMLVGMYLVCLYRMESVPVLTCVSALC